MRVLDEQLDLSVSGDAATCRQALVEISQRRPDVVLLDLGLDGAIAAIRASRSASPSTRVVALGFGGTDGDVIAAAQAGIRGYVGIQQPLGDVPVAIRSVVRGEAPCDGRIVATLLRRVEATAHGDHAGLPLATLTKAERHTLELVSRGLANKEIAAELLVSVATVKSHVSSILRKLDLTGRGRGAAADLFRRSELVTL